MAMNPRLLRPRASGFNPKSMAGLELWLDANNAASITLNGSNVSQWADLSGNNRHAVMATAANQPLYLPTGINSKGAVSFTRTSAQAMYGAFSRTLTGMTVFVLFRYSNTGNDANNRFFAMNVGGANDFSGTNHLSPLLRHGGNGATNVGPYGGGNIASVAAPSYDTPLLYSLVANGSTVSARINNGGASSANRTFNTIYSNYALGSYRSSPNIAADANMDGYLSEIIVYGSALSDAARVQVATYLSKKWGVTIS